VRAQNRLQRLAPEVRERLVARLIATEGLNKTEVARELGVTPGTVYRDLAKPQVQQTLKDMREVIKRQILEQAAQGLVEPAMEMARKKIRAGEAKDFDAAMRGLNALEKTTASASGEAQRLEVDQRVAVLNRTELYARIENLLGDA
jgi:predicted transcriptional regulator